MPKYFFSQKISGMKVVILTILCIYIVNAYAQQTVDSRQRDIVIKNVNVIPMDREQVLNNQVVVIRNGIIAEIGGAGNVKFGRDALVIDGAGKFLLPGLSEMHAHVPPVDDLEPMKEVLLLYAVNGITNIRGMLGHPRHLELRSKIRSGEVLGPRLYTAGPSFNGESVKDVATGVRMVHEQKAAGYDFLKLHPGLTKATFAAIAKTAHEEKIPFAGHVSFDVGIWAAIDSGYQAIDHLDGFVESLVPRMDTITESTEGLFGMFIGGQADATRIPKLMTALRDHHIWIVPTQCLAERWMSPVKDADAMAREPEMVYMSAETLNNWTKAKKNMQANPQYNATAVNDFIRLRRQLIYDCYKQGGGLLLGSDAPQVFDVPGFSIHHELKYLVQSGLTPYEALRTGTANVGAFFNRADMGTIRKGALADLVLVDRNPLQDINNIDAIAGVMLDGRWLSKEFIDATLAKLRKQ